MSKRKLFLVFISVLLIVANSLWATGPVLAGGPDKNGTNLPYVKHGKITPADRKAAALNRAAVTKQGTQLAQASALVTDPTTGLMIPDVLGTTPNWANSPAPVLDVSGNATPGTGMRKFVDALPTLTQAKPDTLAFTGSDYYEIGLVEYSTKLHTDLQPTLLRGYVQLKTANVPGTIGLTYTNNTPIYYPGTTTQVMAVTPPSYLGPVILANRDRPVRVKFYNLLPSTAQGGNLFIPVDTTYMGAGSGPNGEVTNIKITNSGSGYTAAPAITIGKPGSGGTQATAVATILGGKVNTIKITNPGAGYTTTPTITIGKPPAGGVQALAAGTIAPTVANYTQNRATIHLHGGTTPWISDGTPHQWTTPATEKTAYPKGISVSNVPDMPDPGDGAMTFFYSNQQSARIMFYHDHAYGITRLNVYAGEAAGYLLTDPVEQAMINGTSVTYKDPNGTTQTATFAKGTLPDLGIPLIIQDKTFVDATTVGIQDPTWLDPKLGLGSTKNGVAHTGDLWFPHVYMPNQNPYDPTGANAMGRWDYGPWFWPPYTGLQFGAVTNKYQTINPLEANYPYQPGTPDGRGISPSGVPEAFMDTPLVNGKAYPTLNVDPKAYRFRILNAANDRFWNLQLYQATSSTNGIVNKITVTNNGIGYTSAPAVTITNATGDTTGSGASAVATVDLLTGSPTYGQVTGITMKAVGSGYTAVPSITIAPPPAGGTQATASASLYTAPTEVGMVAFNSSQNALTPFPAWWYDIGQPFTFDDRDGGVPDPRMRGPAMIQIGTEGGFLPNPAVILNQPVNYEYNRKNIVVLNVKQHALLIGPAERADVLVDFSNFAGKTLILYNDGPAPIPAFDPRNDYYTGNPNQTDTGGAPSTLAGYGPNTRTIMQIVVGAGTSSTAPVDDYNATTLASLQSVLPKAFAASQDTIIVPQQAYSASYPGQSYLTGTAQYVKIQDNSLPFDPIGPVGQITMNLQPKAIQELFTVDYGRMNATLGVELPFSNGTNQTTIPYGYVDPPTELVAFSNEVVPIGSTGDGTQIWKITHNGVDTHAIHVHMFTAQVINRVGWDGAIRPPDPNEMGWKDTIRMNPLEDCIVALRPIVLTNVPFQVPFSTRPLDVTRPLGSSGSQFFNVDPNGNPVTVTNHVVNFGWEYVWHCHLLGHEENDMMRPMAFVPPPNAPTNLTAVIQGGKVKLSWTNPAGTTAITVQRATDANFSLGLTTFNLGAVSTYTDGITTKGVTYYYRVYATGPVVGDSGTAGYPTLAATSAASNSVTIVGP